MDYANVPDGCMEYEAAGCNDGTYMWGCGHKKTSGKRALFYVF